MKVNSTEVQNNFGKYLILSSKEDIIITKNGMEIAKLTGIDNRRPVVKESGAAYEIDTSYGCYGGKKGTYEEFLELTKDNDDEQYEYIDGEIYCMASPRATHQIILTDLFVIFYRWFEGKSCRPVVAPFDIKLRRWPEDINVVQPDIMVICDLNENLNEKDYYMGIPTLVVEIISPSTRGKDIVKKLDLYMHCGIKEYWTINPMNREVAVFLLNDGKILDSKAYNKSDIAESFTFKGLKVELGKLFKE
jgi:prevent-host-death family protein